MTKKALVKMLGDMGFSVFPKDIFTAAYATANYCKNMGYKKIYLLSTIKI
jgi:ribonucleotide monophosphatase NagD (HAD superfamily)